MSLIAVDPAKLSVGWAAFEGARLRSCGLIRQLERGSFLLDLGRMFADLEGPEVVIEVPQVYQQRSWAGDPNDLIDVALTAGSVQGFARLCRTILVRPRQWKGTRSKSVCNKLTLKSLDEGERLIYERIAVPRHLRHNVLDAIGIGLWRLERR